MENKEKVVIGAMETVQPLKCLHCKCEDLSTVLRGHIMKLSHIPSTGETEAVGDFGLADQQA